MKTRTTIILISVLSFFFGIKTEAQVTDPTSSVSKFAEYMSEWSKTGDDSYRMKMDNEVFPQKGKNSGYEKCLVGNNLMRLFAQRDSTGMLHQVGTNEVMSYLKELTKAFDEGMKYKHEEPEWKKDYEAPTYGNLEVPTQFAVMNYSTNGFLKTSGTDLFFVQGDYIVKIMDSDDPLAKALRLYHEKKYNEAFRIFREVAYAEPDNYDAQYWTTVMEIKKQGCGFLNSKVRDMEAAWWMMRGRAACVGYDGFDNDFHTIHMNNIPLKSPEISLMLISIALDLDYTALPYSSNKKLFYQMLMRGGLFSEGLMPFEKDNLMGYMNESGKVVIPCRFDYVFPFDSNERALVMLNGYFGYVNRMGDMAIQARYNQGCMKFINGKTFVLHGDVLLLIDENGKVVKEVDKGFDKLRDNRLLTNGQYYAFVRHKNSDKWNMYDFDGNIVMKEFNVYSLGTFSW